MGCRVRDRLCSLVEDSGLFADPAMLTLTCDRRNFPEGPESALRAIVAGRFIPRLMKLLDVPIWASVLEFQMATGDGWPHWHLLLDRASHPGHPRKKPGWVNFATAWAYWRDKWKLGGLDVSANNGKPFASALHAVRYITKYLMKQPDGGYPLWVLNGHSFNFVGASGALPPLVADLTNVKPKGSVVERERREYAPRRSNLERTAGCTLRTKLFKRITDKQTGEVRLTWLGDLPCTPADLVTFTQQHELPLGFSFKFDADTAAPTIYCDRQDVTRADVAALDDFIRKHTNAENETAGRTEMCKSIILDDNVFKQRETYQGSVG